MAICGTCGNSTPRVRVLFEIDGKPLPEPKDECPQCAPQAFDKLTDPSDNRLWMGWEANPAHYKKTDDGYQASDSKLQDLEDWAVAEAEPDPRAAQMLAERRAYCAAHSRNETPQETLENDAKVRAMLRGWEAEVRLAERGFVMVESE